MSTEVHAGPFAIPGTGHASFRAEDAKEVFDATGVRASVRKRGNWSHRMLTLSGPAKGINSAKDLPMKIILRNQQAEPRPFVERERDDWWDKQWNQGSWKGSWSKRTWTEWRGGWHTDEQTRELQKQRDQEMAFWSGRMYQGRIDQAIVWHTASTRAQAAKQESSSSSDTEEGETSGEPSTRPDIAVKNKDVTQRDDTTDESEATTNKNEGQMPTGTTKKGATDTPNKDATQTEDTANKKAMKLHTVVESSEYSYSCDEEEEEKQQGGPAPSKFCSRDRDWFAKSVAEKRDAWEGLSSGDVKRKKAADDDSFQ